MMAPRSEEHGPLEAREQRNLKSSAKSVTQQLWMSPRVFETCRLNESARTAIDDFATKRIVDFLWR